MLTKTLNVIDSIPMPILAVFAVVMAVLPIQPEPHLLEKLTMLADGSLTKPIDIFDLFLHSSPLVLVAIKLRPHR